MVATPDPPADLPFLLRTHRTLTWSMADDRCRARAGGGRAVGRGYLVADHGDDMHDDVTADGSERRDGPTATTDPRPGRPGAGGPQAPTLDRRGWIRPGSLLWTTAGDPGDDPRSCDWIMQLMPGLGAGVTDYSDFFNDPSTASTGRSADQGQHLRHVG